MWGVPLIISSEWSLSSAVHMRYISSVDVIFCFEFIVSGACCGDMLSWNVGELFLFGLSLLTSKFTINAKGVICSMSSLVAV